MMALACTKQFEHMLKQQLKFYREVLSLIEEEKGKLERMRPLQELLPLIKKRQILFSCAQELTESIFELKKKEGIEVSLETLGFDKLLKETKSLLKESMEKDLENQVLFKQWMHSLKQTH